MAGLYADQNVAPGVVALIRASGHRVVATQDAGRLGAKDDEQLLMAAERGWILLTHDINDYELLHDAWRRWSRAWNVSPRHSGILIVPQRWAWGRIAAEVDRFLAGGPALENELYR